MLHQIKELIKRLIPESWLDWYHSFLAKIAAFWYGNPSQKLIVIGVTGTNGKTTTAYLTAKALEAGGVKTGCTTTAIFKVADKEWLNATKMTMLGRFALQKTLKQMVDAGCKYAVVETSSQGVLQHRHKQIAYDIGVFTNLTPEHIEAHGGFENYKQAKIEFLKHIASLPPKVINGKTVPRAFVLNKDDEHAKDFAIKGPQVIWYGTHDADIVAQNVQETVEGVKFELRDSSFEIRLQLLGRVNVYNALAALSVAKVLDVNLSEAASKLEAIKNIPGRFERIDEGQPWQVMVDYAPEPGSLARLYEDVRILKPQRIIHVLGSCGGGRDVARRPILGKMAAQNSAIVIVTNEDPYDDDPMEIIKQVAEGAKEGGKIEGENLFLILDRASAIQKAMDLAQPGDLVLMTGKGSEQRICVANGKKIPWDERKTASKAILSTIAQRG
ncbi:MAG: UDP-N-acetylmuramoyl-L-alanyl-D-glutamate--2,6-diaminopimelate ligase [Patescibacteria group bacterium]|jgi:UDP-N-acetylmuramoyl-L-alanyl-D-glutamate--2,6-diaminopimelate ligase